MKRTLSSRKRVAAFRTSGASAPAGNADPAKDKSQPKKYLREYARWLWPYRWQIGALFMVALITATLDMVWPLAIKAVIDGLTGETPGGGGGGGDGGGATFARSMRRLNWLGAGIILLLIVKQGLDSYRSFRTEVLNATVIFRLRKRLFRRLIGLPLGELSEMKSGGITSRLSGDVDSVSGLIQMALISPGVALIRVVLTVVILFWLSWRLAIVALIAMPPLAAASFFWMRKVRPIYRSIREDRSEIDARVNETFGGIRVVRAFRREPREELAYATGHHTSIRKSLYAERLELVLGGVWGLLIPATVLLIVWYGGYLKLRGQAHISDIVAFQIYAMMLLQPIWQIVNSVSQTQRALAAMERVFEVLGKPLDKPDAPDALPAPRHVERIRFEGVNFEYRPGTAVIGDFSLDVPGGATVALVGPSGAGKTTLTDLVARFHDPTRGRILLNGIDLRRLRLSEYRRLLAVVQQEVFLFDGSVADNIAYGRRHVSREQIIDAARRANAHEFIRLLPEGYDTIIGERGFKLSGGQRQRLSIARAILADPQILILDEATSNLDTESEQLIQSSLAELFKGRTTFVIAHRLSTVTHADVIVAMDAGRIVEVGTHAELMDRRGFYFEMVERQWRSFSAGSESAAAVSEQAV
ncbi:MAG TPA: ABC transporter ATP-binding protein [Tepidisphaeraceae bacterium]|nr:ABC transporter ATP-binding protein [Tepidisphaeraceae bacterium]